MAIAVWKFTKDKGPLRASALAFTSSLGLVPLFMFWVYLMWLAVLFGLQVSATLQMLHGRKLDEVDHKAVRAGISQTPFFIVADSVPLTEYEEVLAKSAILRRALAIAEEVTALGRTARTVPGSVADADTARGIVAAAHAELGGLDEIFGPDRALDGRELSVDDAERLLRARGLASLWEVYQTVKDEVEAALGVTIGPDRAKLESAGRTLLEELGCHAVLVTRGSHGMSLFERGRPPLHIPIHGTDEVADVTGAGDTVITAFSLALLAGGSAADAARIANYAAGIVVTKAGIASVTRTELVRAIRRDRASRT